MGHWQHVILVDRQMWCSTAAGRRSPDRQQGVPGRRRWHPVCRGLPRRRGTGGWITIALYRDAMLVIPCNALLVSPIHFSACCAASNAGTIRTLLYQSLDTKIAPYGASVRLHVLLRFPLPSLFPFLRCGRGATVLQVPVQLSFQPWLHITAKTPPLLCNTEFLLS